MNRLFILSSFVLLLSVSCIRPPEPIKFSGETQGTYYSIIYYDSQQRDLQDEVDSILHDFDMSVSLWVPNSIISKINRNEPDVAPDKYFIDNFNLSEEVAANTNGAFDLTVGTLVRAWGFGFDEKKHENSQIIDSILQFTGYQKVHLEDGKVVKDDKRTTFDFNAIAQGYSVDVIGNFLDSRGIQNWLVDIGGEVRGKGNKPDGSFWRVGIEKPAQHKDDPRDLKAVIELENKSVATSGNYRKFYIENGIRYSHTIDPKTGRPVQHSLLSASVMADSTAVADAYATSFMVMGLEKSIAFLKDHKNLEAFFIYSDKEGNYQIYATDGFKSYIREEY